MTSAGILQFALFESTFVKTGRKLLEENRGLVKHQDCAAHSYAMERYVKASMEMYGFMEMVSANISQIETTRTDFRK